MDTQAIPTKADTAVPSADSPEKPSLEEAEPATSSGVGVSDDEFEKAVQVALETVNGTLLFKARSVEDDKQMHVAAARIGLGDSRQILFLTLPVDGGHLKVETASRSHNPMARIALSYASVLDAWKTAA